MTLPKKAPWIRLVFRIDGETVVLAQSAFRRSDDKGVLKAAQKDANQPGEAEFDWQVESVRALALFFVRAHLFWRAKTSNRDPWPLLRGSESGPASILFGAIQVAPKAATAICGAVNRSLDIQFCVERSEKRDDKKWEIRFRSSDFPPEQIDIQVMHSNGNASVASHLELVDIEKRIGRSLLKGGKGNSNDEIEVPATNKNWRHPPRADDPENAADIAVQVFQRIIEQLTELMGRNPNLQSAILHEFNIRDGVPEFCRQVIYTETKNVLGKIHRIVESSSNADDKKYLKELLQGLLVLGFPLDLVVPFQKDWEGKDAKKSAFVNVPEYTDGFCAMIIRAAATSSLPSYSRKLKGDPRIFRADSLAEPPGSTTNDREAQLLEEISKMPAFSDYEKRSPDELQRRLPIINQLNGQLGVLLGPNDRLTKQLKKNDIWCHFMLMVKSGKLQVPLERIQTLETWFVEIVKKLEPQ